MIGENGTYFTQQNCVNPYIIISGMTDDMMVSDRLTQSNLELELHHHLRQNGFDAVVFFNSLSMIRMYDMQSSYIVQHAKLPTPQELQSLNEAALNGQSRMEAAAPNGTFRRRTPAAQSVAPTNIALNLSLISDQTAWQRILTLLRQDKIRCAFVFTSLHSLQHELDELPLEVLPLFNRNRTQNGSIAIFISHATNDADLEQMLRVGNRAWTLFASNSLLPGINPPENSEPEANRVIRLGPPNAAEIRNFLTSLRIAAHNPLLIELADLDEICIQIAAQLTSTNRSLSFFSAVLDRWRKANPEAALTLQNCTSILGGKNYRSVSQRLSEMVGLEDFRRFIDSWGALQDATQNSMNRMPEHSSRLTPRPNTAVVRGHSLNVALVGEPGTGKSTVAELLGELYRERGLLPQGHLQRVSAAQLISPNVGASAQNLHHWVERSLGGVLFIDEAYALMNNRFGRDVIDALVNDMSQYAGRFAVVLAGYKDPINELLASNDGLFGRFPNIIELKPYTPPQMLQIFRSMAKAQEGVVFSEALEKVLPDFFNGWVNARTPDWRNAGEAETLLTTMRKNCAVRQRRDHISGATLILTPEDIPEKLQRWTKPRVQSLEEAIAAIKNIRGLGNVKRFLLELAQMVSLSDVKPEPGAYIFQGPPGTGKTMMGDRLADLLNQLGVISRCVPVVYTARELVEPPRRSRKPGEQPSPNENSLQEAVRLARGGLLFIDEAHQLADPGNDRGREVLRQLVPIMEDAEFRASTCIVLAGYSSQINNIFEVDGGLVQRFPTKNRIQFNNYTAQELVEIMQIMADDIGETLEADFINRTLVTLTHELSHPQPDFGNARFIRNTYLPKARIHRNHRILREQLGAGPEDMVTPEMAATISHEIRHTLTGHDVPPPYHLAAGPINAAPPVPRTAETMLAELYEKDELVSFVREKTHSGETPAFYGDAGSGSLHFSLAGPTGSGRRTALAAVANAFCDAGLITSREVRYLTKGDLEGAYVGHTSGRTRAAIAANQGGLIVISNPSSMLPLADGRTFGPEAINTVLGCIPEYEQNTCFVFVDTQEGMEAFFKHYPHARRVLGKNFQLNDLSLETMQRIFHLKAQHRLTFAPDVQELLDDFIANWVNDRGGLGDNFTAWTNGAAIDQLLTDVITSWTNQGGETLKDADGYPVRLITRDMFPPSTQTYFKSTRSVAETALQELMGLTGLHRVKRSVRTIETKLRRIPRGRVSPGLYCFMGNPGTGKTTVAKLMGGVLRSLGALSQGYVIERKALDLVAQLDRLDAIIRMARNNVLFIDEAYELLHCGARGEAFIAQLLKVLEDVEVMQHTCIILAGYRNEMEQMMRMNSGLRSRFGTQDSILYFDDYTPDELMSILADMCAHPQKYPQIGAYAPLMIASPRSEGFMQAARSIMQGVIATHDPDFGNARFVRNLLHDAVSNQVLRLDEDYGRDNEIPEEEFSILIREDIPARLAHFVSVQERPAATLSAAQMSVGTARAIPDTMLHAEISRLSPSIMFLEVETNDGGKGSGTGFVITPDGRLLTCAHVVRNARSVRARLLQPGMPGGDTRWFNCTVLSPVREDLDMAVLAIEGGSNFTPLSLRAPEETVSLTEPTLIIGYPFGTRLDRDTDRLQPTHFEGRVCTMQHQGTTREYIGVDSSGKCGNSGSPVISREDGRVIGLFCGSVTEGDSLKEEINYFRPISLFWQHFVTGDNA